MTTVDIIKAMSEVRKREDGYALDFQRPDGTINTKFIRTSDLVKLPGCSEEAQIMTFSIKRRTARRLGIK